MDRVRKAGAGYDDAADVAAVATGDSDDGRAMAHSGDRADEA